jgi:hypothetical protein
MAAIFQIRRGTTETSLQEGELYLNQTTGSLQIGSGSTTVTLAKLNQPNIGNFNVTGDVTIGGTITIGDTTSDNLVVNADLSSSIIPNNDNAFDLGSASFRYRNIYGRSISGSFSGSVNGINEGVTAFSTSLDLRLDRMEASASLYDVAMSGSKRLYVSPSGSDANDGLEPYRPFRTIAAAVASLGSVNPSVQKRYTIFVGSGEYVEQNPITLHPGLAIVGDNLRTVRLTAANPTKDFFHVHDGNYINGVRFLDLQYPAFACSFPASTVKPTISGGTITSASIIHSLSGYTANQTNLDVGIIVEGPDASGSVPTARVNTNASGQITAITFTGGTNYTGTETPHISIPAPAAQRPSIGTSPYIQNCSSITGPFTTAGVKIPVTTPLPYDITNVFGGGEVVDENGAGGGLRIDGNACSATSPLRSMVADAFTQVNQGGPGHLVINNGYTQFVSCFTTFCTYGFKTANGGFANVSNSVIDFGKYGIISKTYFPTTYNTGSSLETKTSQVSGFILTDHGSGYTYGQTASVSITGGGYSVQATAYATINADTSISEIKIINSGSGYTSQPTVTVQTPTGTSPRVATTQYNLAEISGVSSILVSLQTGSRGIDISSNMTLSGSNYLVTGVTLPSGSSSPLRRVTTYPAPPSVTTGDPIKFYQLSNISTGGLVMEYVGSGVTYNSLPFYGGVPISTREVTQIAPGKIFYSTVDNIGNLKIGSFFAVNQLTGEVTINANSFNLSGLNAIGPFKRNGVAVGVVLQEVSDDTSLLNSQGIHGQDTVPTQNAVYTFVSAVSSSISSSVNSVSSSISSSIGVLNTKNTTLASVTSSFNTFTASVNGHISDINTKTGSFETKFGAIGASTSSLNTFSASVNGHITNINSFTGSYATTGSNSFNGNQTITGSLVVSQNLTVLGSASILVISSSTLNIGTNLITANTSTPGVRFGGLAIIDSGSSPARSGSWLFDSVNDNWIMIHQNASTITSSVGLMGAETYNNVGNETYPTQNRVVKGLGYEHIGDSNITDTGTEISLNSLTSVTGSFVATAGITGSIRATNGVVSGSSQISLAGTSDYTSLFGGIGASTSSLNSFTASNANTSLNTFTASNANTSLNTYTGSVSDPKFLTLQTLTASMAGQVARIQESTASLNSFTSSYYTTSASFDTRIAAFASSGVPAGTVSGSIQVLGSSTIHSGSSGDYQFNSIGVGTAPTSTIAKGNFYGKVILQTGINTAVGSQGLIFAYPGLTNNLTHSIWSGHDVSVGNTNKLDFYVSTTAGTTLNVLSLRSTQPSVIGLDSGLGLQINGNLAVTGSITATNDITAFATSDIRLKENIQPIQNALEKVESISGNTYDWKEGYEEIHSHKGNDVGVIAQEIEAVLPQLVVNRDNGYKAVQYEKIIPLLIEAIKELSNKIDRLENK